MVKVKVAELVHPKFKGALLGLKGQEMSFDTAFKVNALIKKVEKKIVEVEELKMEILLKYCELDENGELVPNTDEQGNPILGSVKPIEDEEKSAEFKQKFMEYLNAEVEVDAPKLDPASLRDTRVSGNDLEFLDVFLLKQADLKLV